MYSDRPFAIVGVNSDRDLEEALAKNEKLGISWRSFQDASSKPAISEIWCVDAWPTTYILDKQGRIRFKDLRGEKLEAAITKLLEEE